MARSASPVPCSRGTRTTSGHPCASSLLRLAGSERPGRAKERWFAPQSHGLDRGRVRRSVGAGTWVSTSGRSGSGLRPAHPPGWGADRPPTLFHPRPTHPREAEPLQPLVFAERGTPPILRPKSVHDHRSFRRAIGPPFGRSRFATACACLCMDRPAARQPGCGPEQWCPVQSVDCPVRRRGISRDDTQPRRRVGTGTTDRFRVGDVRTRLNEVVARLFAGVGQSGGAGEEGWSTAQTVLSPSVWGSTPTRWTGRPGWSSPARARPALRVARWAGRDCGPGRRCGSRAGVRRQSGRCRCRRGSSRS